MLTNPWLSTEIEEHFGPNARHVVIQAYCKIDIFQSRQFLSSNNSSVSPFAQVKVQVLVSFLTPRPGHQESTPSFQSHINNVNWSACSHLWSINLFPQFSLCQPPLCALCLPPWGAELSVALELYTISRSKTLSPYLQIRTQNPSV